ncbi:MAG TPA: OsmC family protein [Bryobacteraceae bacterium]|nr:OsmC family protein [Bryobacteraceae bacterium]
MKEREHQYRVTTTWIGNLGTGTSDYRAYSRNHEIKILGKRAPLQGSADQSFRGDPARYTPEELLVASLSSCHMLWFLHLCVESGITVIEYEDAALGTMAEHPDGSGEFTSVLIRPRAVITDPARIPDAAALHHRAHDLCFIARSVNFPVEHEPVVVAA